MSTTLRRSILAALTILDLVSARIPRVETRSQQAVWNPEVGSTYQIVLSGAVQVSNGRAVPDVDIFDIDLFDTPASTIAALKGLGKRVICYFSAGTSEDWRPDYSSFRESDKGSGLPDWQGERYLNLRSQNVFNVMAKRISYAASVGCDAIDPDNLDGFSNANGMGLTSQDSVNFMRKLAAEAAKYGMSTGLKNAQTILSPLKDVVSFAVNEECAKGGDYGNCDPYVGFGKPVYHIEYVTSHFVSRAARDSACLTYTPVEEFTTIIKELSLDGWALYCDGTQSTTPTAPTED